MIAVEHVREFHQRTLAADMLDDLPEGSGRQSGLRRSRFYRIAFKLVRMAERGDRLLRHRRIDTDFLGKAHHIVRRAADAGFDKLRINPGNIGGDEKVRAVVEKAGEKGIPIRIGVNHGSVEPELIDKFGGPKPQAMVESAMRHVELLERHNFKNIVISIKASSPLETIECYETVANRCDYPLHLGVTEAGPAFTGAIKTSVALGHLLCEGIGDTLRVSLSADIEEEIRAAWAILKSLGLRRKGLELISCPSCARTETDVYKLAEKVEKALAKTTKDIKIAVMGCLVNGPGEAAEADLALIGGKGKVTLTRKGQVIGHFDESEIFDALLREIETTP